MIAGYFRNSKFNMFVWNVTGRRSSLHFCPQETRISPAFTIINSEFPAHAEVGWGGGGPKVSNDWYVKEMIYALKKAFQVIFEKDFTLTH